MIAVVVGPPCAGKSTYVRAMARPGDVTVDYDALAVALGSDRRHEAPRSVAECAFAARSAAVSALIAGGYDGYVIHTRPSAGDMGRYRRAGARFVLLDPGEDECLARAERDRRPPRTFDAIRSWYENPPRIPTD